MQTLKQLLSGELKGATSIKLSEGLLDFPKEIYELADTLEILDLSRNKLRALPADFGRLKKLKILFCSENPFTALPEVLGDCPLLNIVGFKANLIEMVPAKALNANLRWLILTDNKIAELPAEIGNCYRMEKLMLAGNKLKTLPTELAKCNNLCLLRISANQLAELPDWLLRMPKLSWLAFSGNPFSEKPKIDPLDFIDWNVLELKHVLGEGASGVISKAVWKVGNVLREVAVKVFKGAVTSDGLPEDEMNACITAGVHPGLVELIGQIKDHPEDKPGLVMSLIPERFYNLGGSPSFESCTRDVFKPDLSLSLAQILKIAQTIASVAAQLHTKGIMHGDLYAHNTLIDDEGNTLFGDFGAASFYNKADVNQSAALERLEVCAYGYLLDDLLGLCKEATAHQAMFKLAEIRNACLSPDILSRPGFQDLQFELAQYKLAGF